MAILLMPRKKGLPSTNVESGLHSAYNSNSLTGHRSGFFAFSYAFGAAFLVSVVAPWPVLVVRSRKEW